VVVANVKADDATEIARQFERIHGLLARVAPLPEGTPRAPLTVFVARDGATLKLLMPTVVQVRGRNVVGGRFVDLPTHQFIQLLSSGDDHGLTIVFHEYFHYFARRHGVRLPVWAEEGLADFWGASRIENGDARIGRIPMERPRAMDSRSLLPIERLLAVDRVSREYIDRLRVGRFYAQSWALVHYLILGDTEHRREGQLSRYLALVDDGRDPVVAGREAFGDLESLEEELKDYVRKGRYPHAVMPAPVPPGAGEVATRGLSEPEAAGPLALALLHSEPPRVAEPVVELALAGAPEAVATRVAAGLLAFTKDEHEKARAQFERAAALPGASAMALYGRALTRLLAGRSPEALEAAEVDLRAALALDGDFAAAHSRIAEVRLARGAAPVEALTFIRRARELQPDDWFYRIRELELRERAGERGVARAEVAHVVEEALASENSIALNNQCWYGTLLGYAREFLPLCEKSVALVRAESSSLDSRGVARALTGDLAGAAADFRAALAAAGDWSEAVRASRRSWIDELEAGRNPLDGDAIQRLLDSPEESGGWGR
jgi:tetratricopeptide (TPR) repeat protein